MNVIELGVKLNEVGVHGDVYSLSGGLPNERHVLGCENGKWEVYYSERGMKSNLRQFENEGGACQYMLDLLIR